MKYILVLISILFIGCGGGGGGSSPVPAPVPAPVIISEIPVSEPASIVAFNWNTQEYNYNNGNAVIKASGAYENGYTGQGVTVAVIDSGISFTHPDLIANIVAGRDFTAATYDINDGNFYYVNNGISSSQIANINVLNYGTTFITAPEVTITGNGSGATAVSVLNPNGTLKGVYVTNPGTGYTTASVSVAGATAEVIYGTEDKDGHGSAMSGIIAAQKDQWDASDAFNYSVQGVAFNASLMPVKVLDDDGAGSSWSLHRGIEWASNNNAKILNLSLGDNFSSSTDSYKIVYQNALNNNSTFVIAAGNEGLNCLPVAGSLEGRCSFPAALPWLAGNSDLLTRDGGWVVVGSVKSDLTISSFSNRAGVMKDNYIVAPGEGIRSTYLDEMNVVTSGTSIATAFVSGAMALMYEKYPHLTGNQISEIYFSTATDLGAAGIDNIYGNGLINIEKAFSPIGSLSVPSSQTVGGSSTPLAGASLILPKSLGGLKIKSLSQTIALDGYGRDFSVDMSSNVSFDKSEFSFENFSIIKYDNLLLGFDKYSDKVAFGFYAANTTVMFSFSDDLLGASGTNALSLGNANSYYMTVNKAVKFDEVKVDASINYALGESSNKNGLIQSVDNLQSAGASVKLTSGFLGVNIESPLSVFAGNVNMKIPTSREVDGTVNYLYASESLKGKREFIFEPFVSYETKQLKAKIELNTSELKENPISFNLGYFF